MCYTFKQNNWEQFCGFAPSINAIELYNSHHFKLFVSHFLHWPCAVVIIVTATVVVAFARHTTNCHCLQLKVLRVYAAGDLDCTIFVNILSSVNMLLICCNVVCLALQHRRCIFFAQRNIHKIIEDVLVSVVVFVHFEW